METLSESMRRALESGRPSKPDAKIPTARSIMTVNLICFRPEQSIGEAIELLLKHSISGGPVVDEAGKLIGILSEADCMRNLAASRFHESSDPHQEPVEARMSRTLSTIAPQTDIYGVADRFLRDSLRRLPVVDDESGALLGQVSRRDVLRAMQQMW